MTISNATILKAAQDILIFYEMLDFNILQIYETGSQLLRLNPVDYDYIVVVDKPPIYRFKPWGRAKFQKPYQNITLDFIFVTKDFLEQMENFDSELPQYFILYNYMLSEHLIKCVYDSGLEEPHQFKDIFNTDYLTTYRERTQAYVNSRLSLSQDIHNLPSKTFVHFYALYWLFSGNTADNINELKTNMNKIYEAEDNYIELIEEAINWFNNEVK